MSDLEKQSVTRQPDEGRVRLLYSLTESAVQRLQTEEMPDILKPMRSEQQRTLFREMARLAKPDTPGSRFAMRAASILRT